MAAINIENGCNKAAAAWRLDRTSKCFCRIRPNLIAGTLICDTFPSQYYRSCTLLPKFDLAKIYITQSAYRNFCGKAHNRNQVYQRFYTQCRRKTHRFERFCGQACHLVF